MSFRLDAGRIITKCKGLVPQNGHLALLKLQKHSPGLLVGVGVAGIIATAVAASRATLKLSDVVDETKSEITKIKESKEESSKGYSRDLFVAYTRFGFKVVKLYAPSLSFAAVTASCMIGSHAIMSKRNAGLVAAYTMADESFRKYRNRVIDEYGEEKDRDFVAGFVERDDEFTDDAGNKNIRRRVHQSGFTPSQYARFFDELNPCWKPDSEMNKYFLRNEQNYCNDILRVQGHLFLNEVYDRLGIPRTKEGNCVGWLVGGKGDQYVDFGIFDINNPKAREFVNGWEHAILLDFNVDGVILDMI